MGSENNKRRDVVGREFERKSLAGFLTLVVLMALLASIPSVSFTAVAYSGTNEEVNSGPARGNPVTINPSPIAGQVQNMDLSFALADMPDRPAYEMYPVSQEGVENLLAPNYISKALEKQGSGGGASPTGGPDPEPNDPPFLAADVDAYVDAANSQRNASITTTSNDDMYIVFDHEAAPGNRDVLAAKSTDGGTTWNPRNLAVDPNEHERCPSIDADYSVVYGFEIIYSFYTHPSDLEFSWSADGDTWNTENLGGGVTWWWKTSCPHVDVQGDFIAIAQHYYDDSGGGQGETWQIFYTLDNFQNTLGLYYWTYWDPNIHIRQPKVSIMDDDELIVAMNLYDQSNPNPALWYNDTFIMHGVLAGNPGVPGDDVWDAWWGSGWDNQDLTAPTIGANGRQVVWAQEVFSPSAPLATRMLLCVYVEDYQVGMPATDWKACQGTAWLAFDVAIDQRYPEFHRDGAAVHAVWMNGTDINYRFSPDNGASWTGDPTTLLPMKVNQPGVGTALDMWHSPDVHVSGGKPAVAWHDTRNSDEIYFQTWGTVLLYTIDTLPRVWDLWCREVGDAWHPPPYSYLWGAGTQHDIECIPQFEIPNDTRYTFNMWDDGSTMNPYTITVDPADPDIVAIYDVEYYLDMINPGGTTNPPSGYQPNDTWVTIEAFAPPAPPGARYIWVGWTGIGLGSYTGNLNPCVNCVYMNATVTQIANWQLQWEVNFFTDPVGLGVEIDLQPRGTPWTEWFNDSEMYNINAPSPQLGGPGLRYVFSSWSDLGLQSHNVFVDTEWTNFTAYFTPEYQITVDTNVPGLDVRVNGMDYPAPHQFWCPPGPGPWLEAATWQYLGVLGERYEWADWDNGGSQTHIYDCTGIATVTANYVLQRAVNISTNPGGFNVIVNGQPFATPQQFWWNDTSLHTIEALDSIPVGANNRYNFTGWSNFAPRIQVHTTAISDEDLVASYVFQHKITLQSNEPGLSINLDGSPVMLPYVYWCDDGTSHTLNAWDPQEFGDTRFMFNSWSDMGAQIHIIVCSAPAIIRADYDREYRVYINATLDGAPTILNVIAGVVTIPTPAEVWWPADTMMALDTNEFQPSQNPGTGERYKFVDWDDLTIRTRTVNVNLPGLDYVANFKTQYKLTFVDPHGTPTTTPGGEPVTDGIYFDKDASVDIGTDATVAGTTVDHRWRFDSWTGTGGGYTGTTIDPTITMSAPITQTVTWVDQYTFKVVTTYGVATVSGEAEKVSDTEYWFDAGTQATYSMDAEVFTNAPTNTEKAVFESWSGGPASPATMNAPVEVIASWHTESLVTVVSDYGTVTPAAWIVDGQTYSLTIDDIVTAGDTRYVFDMWTTADIGNGGYQGASRQTTLTVIGAITEEAQWITEHRLTIVSTSGDETGVGDPTTVPVGQEWIEEGQTVIIEVTKTNEIGETRYKFKNWVGPVADPNSPSTSVVVNAPTSLSIEWDSEPVFSIMDLWWLFVIIIIVVVVLIALLLMKRKKPAEEEIPPVEEEEYLEEEAPGPPE